MSAVAPFASGLIDRLTREQLEGARLTDPRGRGPLFTDMIFMRLTRIERPKPNEPRLELRMVELLSGLHGSGVKFAFSIAVDQEIVSVWLGAAMSASALRALVDGMFPGLPLDVAPVPYPEAFLQDVDFGVAITGTPSLAPEPESRVPAPLRSAPHGCPFEPLIRGLGAARWTYLVTATPVPLAETKAALSKVEDDIADLRRRYFASTDPAGPNRAAARALQLLETQHSRLEGASHTGRWRAEVFFFAETEEVLGLGQGFLRSTLAGSRSQPTPLRLHRLTPPQRDPPPEAEPLVTGELARFAHPPEDAAVGYEIAQGYHFGLAAALPPPGAKTIRLGRLIHRGRPTPAPVQLALEDLTRHTLVVGVTGSGKTNTCMSILTQAQARKAPFLVIESAKTEYRKLVTRPEFAANLSVFTVGLETVSPLRLNPFEAPPGVPIQSHIDFLKSLFSAAFVLWPPMPYVLETSLYEVYEDRGWDLRTGENFRLDPADPPSGREFPSMRDVVRKVEEVVDRMRYSGDVLRDVKAGLLARLRSLSSGGGKGPMFDTRVSTPAAVLFERPCILELHEIVSDEEKAFLIGLILIRLYEIRKVAAKNGAPPTPHITLIEEAHRLLRNVSMEQGGQVSGNPQGKAIEVFANVLAEVRAFGEGIVIAEQAPAKLLPDAIKNTNLKIVHRLLAEDDRLLLAGAMGLDAERARALAVLRTGEALVFAEGMNSPVAALIDPAPGKDDPISGAELEAKLIARRIPEPAGKAARPLRDPALAVRLANYVRAFLLVLWRPEPAVDIVVEAYRRIESLERSLLGDPPGAMLRRVREILEDEIERRGEFWGWRHGLAQRALGDGVAVLQKLRVMEPDDTRQQDELMRALSACEEDAEDLLGREDRPFAGCDHCLAPCWFRYDAERVVREGMADNSIGLLDAVRFARGEDIGEASFDALQRHCGAVYAPEDGVMQRGLIYCAFTHILADESSRLSDEEASQVGRVLSAFLEKGFKDEEDADASG